MKPDKILGTRNPSLARRGLTIAPQVRLLLPCNVTVRQLDGGSSEVSLVDLLVVLGVITSRKLKDVAEEANIRLVRVAGALRTSS